MIAMLPIRTVNTAGLATGAITSSTLTHAGQIGLSTLTANISPSVGFKIGNVSVGISINPLIGLGTGGFTYGMGIGVSAAYKDLCFGGGFGKGNNYRGWNASATINNWGAGYGKTYYSEGTSPNGADLENQTVGTVSAYAHGGWSVSFSNDCIGDRKDRWRSNAVEITKGSFSIGTSVDTNWGEHYSEGKFNSDTEALLLGKHKEGYGAWLGGEVHFAPIWIGYSYKNFVQRLGYSHPYVQTLTQNFIHKYVAKTNYFVGYDEMRTGLYHYMGSHNPFSIWSY